MKRLTLLSCLLILVVTLFGCATDSNTHDHEKYTLNGSFSYGAVDNSLDKTKIIYDVVINGNKDDIDNIDAQEPLINMEYIDLLLENGPHNAQVKGGDNPYLEIRGSFVFDTAGYDKEDIIDMHLFEGIKIIDKNNIEYILKLNED